MALVQLFQFHNGSIKSDDEGVATASVDLFQFHNGSIKSDGGDDL